jgi:hypothetical protein
MKSRDVHVGMAIAILFFFIGGFIHAYFFVDFSKCPGKETFELPPRAYTMPSSKAVSVASASCPDKLKVTRGNVLAFRTFEDSSPSNPHSFSSMNEYTLYAKTMNQLYGCPILSDADQIVVKSPPSDPVVPSYAFDSKRTYIPFVRGIDPVGYYDWKYTIYDEKNRARKEDQSVSDMPGDPNWGGPEYTNSLIAAGKYKGSDVVMNRPVVKFPTFQ